MSEHLQGSLSCSMAQVERRSQKYLMWGFLQILKNGGYYLLLCCFVFNLSDYYSLVLLPCYVCYSPPLQKKKFKCNTLKSKVVPTNKLPI